MAALMAVTTNAAKRALTTMVIRVKRWERIDAKTVARCGPPTQDDYSLARMYMTSFFSDMSRRPSKVNNEAMHCQRGVQNPKQTINTTNSIAKLLINTWTTSTFHCQNKFLSHIRRIGQSTLARHTSISRKILHQQRRYLLQCLR